MGVSRDRQSRSAADSRPPSPPKAPGLGFILLFLLIYAVLYLGYMRLPDSFLRDVVYLQAIGQVCVIAIDLVAPHEGVQAYDNIIGSSKAALEIVRGCNGIGTLLLAFAAVLAFPAAWKHKLVGLLTGFAVVYAVNILRISGLYFVTAYRPEWFTIVHTYYAPTLIIVICCLFFLLWASRTRPPGNDRGDGV